jgi:hypothetical protein
MRDNNDWKFIMALILVGFIQVLPFIIWPKFARAADNTINIDQIGSNNSFTVMQDGTGHSATILSGKSSDVDYSTYSISQQGAAKTATIEVKAGVSNTFNIQQDGSGNHTANIQNFIGSGNNVNISQSGGGNHSFTASNSNSQTNNGNTVNVTQSGNAGADKAFNLYFNGATGAGVTVQQTNPTQADQGGMNIQCNTCGGNWSYIKF